MRKQRLPVWGLLLALLQMAELAGAQVQAGSAASADSAHVDKTFFTRHDAVLSGWAILGTLAIAPLDEPIARWAQTPSVQGGSTRKSAIEWVTHVNETPLTIAAVATYGVGRIGHMETVADVGLHLSEALILTVASSELLRGPIGRSRPRVTNDNAFIFHFGGGFTHFDERSFPSLHASAAFATAAVLTEEIRVRRPEALSYAEPLLYAAATVPGITRIYLNQHWTSDIAAGAFLGFLLGRKVVRYAHSHQRSKLDQMLLGTTILPLGDGRTLVAVSLPK
jgi:membrane-associated phospholipid phosphatase